MFRVLSLALVACLLMAGSAFADMKIGVFNSQAVAMDSDAAKAAQQKLQSQFGAEKTQLENQAKDLQSKGEALQAQVAKMSAKEREDKQMEFLRLRRAAHRAAEQTHDALLLVTSLIHLRLRSRITPRGILQMFSE